MIRGEWWGAELDDGRTMAVLVVPPSEEHLAIIDGPPYKAVVPADGDPGYADHFRAFNPRAAVAGLCGTCHWPLARIIAPEVTQ